MDALTNKQYKHYDYVSRYEVFPFYYNNNDDKYIYGLTGHIDKNILTVEHTVIASDTLDNLALKYYGRPDYFWVIADFNDIIDVFEPLQGKYKTIQIPSLSLITFVK